MAHTLAIEPVELESPAHYTWSFPGSPVQVRLKLGVVERLQKQLDHPDGSPGEHGLLWGRANGQLTEIKDFTAIPNLERPSINEVAASISSTTFSEPVGYYRVHRDGVLRLNEDDIALAQALFPKPHQVFLLVQPGDSGPATATFFFWDDGRICGEFPFLEFPFDRSLLADAERQKFQSTQKKPTANGQSMAVEARLVDDRTVVARKPSATLKIVAWGFIAALVASTAMALLVGPQILLQRFRSLVSPTPVAATTPVVLSSQIPLGLQAQRQNGDLKLTWNRESSVVMNATSGVLAIEEGGGQRKFTLDPSQVRNGSILYAPTTDQVQIQLTVLDPRGTTSESVIVILPQAGPPKVQAVARREVPSAPIVSSAPPEDAEAGRNIVTRRPTKAFKLPTDQVERLKEPSAPALPDNEPPTLTVGTKAAASIPSDLISPSVAPLPLPAPARPAAMSEPEPSSAPPVYYPAVITNSVTPVFPTALKGLGLKSKTVEIKVSIDETGRVKKAESLPPKEWVPQSMIQSSVEAARLWKFKPARKGTQPIPSEMVLQFAFKPPQ